MTLTVHAPDGVGEVAPGADLAGLLLGALDRDGGERAFEGSLVDGDVVTVSSKVVSKAEGRVRAGDRDSALAEEAVRVVARRDRTAIVRHRLGLTIAAAGIDASNVATGHVVLLPLDPDDSARRLRHDLARRTGANVAVVVTDTSGRAWRTGQTDIAIGCAGLIALDDHRGRVDAFGHELAVTAPAVADEVAGAAQLVQGKLARRPFAVVRGLAAYVLPAGDEGSGAGVLVRPEADDLFGYGAREAVVRAVAGGPESLAGFGGPATSAELADCLHEALPAVEVDVRDDRVAVTTADPVNRRLVGVVARACGWNRVDPPDVGVDQVYRPAVP